MVQQYYVYSLRDPTTRVPFYVGKGLHPNRSQVHLWETTSGKCTNLAKCSAIKAILDNNNMYVTTIEFRGSLAAVQEKERELIRSYGRIVDGGTLTNIHPGGGGNGRASKGVDQYTLGGVFVKHHTSCGAAALEMGASISTVTACLRGEQKSSSGFLWISPTAAAPTAYRRQHYSSQAVTAVDSTDRVFTFNSTLHAAESLFNGSLLIKGNKSRGCKSPFHYSINIRRCCVGQLKTYKGYSWSYSTSSDATRLLSEIAIFNSSP